MAQDHLAQVAGGDRPLGHRQELAAAGRGRDPRAAGLAGGGLHAGRSPRRCPLPAPWRRTTPATRRRSRGSWASPIPTPPWRWSPRWRGRFDEAVLVVDQFEELFTLNPPEVQSSFVGLLRRLVDAADVHVVLAMRDDFLYQCQRFPEIAPDLRGLTPLGAPRADALRRALTEPAARRLHRFESEILVDRMVAEVEDQRGALPLLAFAVRRLWEKRDREQRVLTEDAYDDIGGVGGRARPPRRGGGGRDRLTNASRWSARSSETSSPPRALERCARWTSCCRCSTDQTVAEGAESLPLRRPATHPYGRRALSLTPARDAAREVLDKLIDARLLTTFETHDDEEPPPAASRSSTSPCSPTGPASFAGRPRTQEGAQLRDELRQAARTWDEHGRHDDRCGPAPHIASSSSGASATRAASPRSRKPSRMR